MFSCPNCEEKIDQADLENGFCPHCGDAFEDDAADEEAEAV
jgi:predicted amidophosphoribosyltransferase